MAQAHRPRSKSIFFPSSKAQVNLGECNKHTIEEVIDFRTSGPIIGHRSDLVITLIIVFRSRLARKNRCHVVLLQT